MKTGLYKKYVKYVCERLDLSKKRLFSRDFPECMLRIYKFDFGTKELVADNDRLVMLSHRAPLSQIYSEWRVRERWFIKHWRHSHWKPYVQTKIDLGHKEEDAVLEVLKRNPSRI